MDEARETAGGTSGHGAAGSNPATRSGAGGAILTVNAGSSSIKLAAFAASDTATPLLTATIERIGTPQIAARIAPTAGTASPVALDGADSLGHEAALAALLPPLAAMIDAPILAAGHRIVHGGVDFTAPVAVDETVLSALGRLVPLARTHQPHGIAAIRTVARQFPAIPQIACFDTAFHATIPDRAKAIALPAAVRAAGVRRYGFHGLSYQWIAGRLPALMGRAAEGRVVVAHLGNGASLCGLVARESRATTMGFTPLDGLVMGERPGLTDPGAVLFMLEEMGMDIAAVRDALFKRSGLLGLSDLSNDMRTLAGADCPAARFAIEVYVHRVVREIGAMAAEIGGLDALVFTGGIGENAAAIRADVVAGCGWLGLALDAEANAARATRISPPGSPPVMIVPANEEAVIAEATARRLAPA